jgi:hypothetical protein
MRFIGLPTRANSSWEKGDHLTVGFESYAIVLLHLMVGLHLLQWKKEQFVHLTILSPINTVHLPWHFLEAVYTIEIVVDVAGCFNVGQLR